MLFEVSERWLIQVAFASAVAVVIAALMRPGKAGTARIFPMISALALLAAIAFVSVPVRIEVATSQASEAPWFWQSLGALPAIVVLAWLAVAAGLVIYRVARLVAELRQIRLADRTSSAVQALSSTLAKQIGLRRGVDVVIHDDFIGPCASSLGSNTIILPSDAAQWKNDTLRAVLCHEVVHLRRRDDRWLLLIRLVRDLYWPLVWLWWLPSLFERHVEASCDDEASDICGDAVAYCSALGEVTRRTLYRQRATAVPFGGGAIAMRVRRFLGARSSDLDSSALYWLGLLRLLPLRSLPRLSSSTGPLLSHCLFTLFASQNSTAFTVFPFAIFSSCPMSG